MFKRVSTAIMVFESAVGALWCVWIAYQHFGVWGLFFGAPLLPFAPIYLIVREGRWLPAVIIYGTVPVTALILAGIATAIKRPTGRDS